MGVVFERIGGEGMVYGAEELWSGEVYPSLSIDKKERNKKTEQLIKLFQKNLLKIKEVVAGKQEKKEAVTDWGTHIAFPKLNIKENGAEINCRIRVNPCWSYPLNEEIEHTSKVFVILGSNSQVESGKPVRNFFVSLEEKAKKIQDEIKKIINEIVNKERNSIYSIPIKNVGFPISKESELQRLFSRKSSEVNNILQKDEEAKNIIGDVLSIHSNRDISNPIEKLYDEKTKIDWRVIRANPNLVYGIEANKEVAKFTGFAGLPEEKVDYNVLHALFHAKVVQIIHGLYKIVKEKK